MQINATNAVQAIRPADDAPARTAEQTAERPAEQGEATPAAPVRLLNPQPVIDPALGIVVTEYFNRAGDLTNQYPTEKALENYRIYGEGGSDKGSAP